MPSVPSPFLAPTPVLLAYTLACLAIQIGYWAVLGLGFKRVQQRQPEGPAPDGVGLTVVVAARNEEANLPGLLDALERQTLAPRTVIIADDGSTDGTAAIVQERAASWASAGGPALTLVSVPDGTAEAAGLPRKKHALTQAIAAAPDGRLAFTDADCRPPPSWLGTLARHAAPDGVDDGAVLIGYGPYPERPGWLNAFVRYETFVTAHQGAASVGLGRPFLAVGRNLSYPKSLFARIGGFDHSAASLSGDDDLLVQEVARTDAAPVRYVLDPDGFVPSEPPPSFGAWVRQKRRHASAGRHYSRSAKVHLVLFHWTHLILWLSVPVLYLAQGAWWGAGFLAVRLLVQRGVLRSAEEAFRVRDLTLAQPVLEFLYLCYNTVVAPLGVFKPPQRW